MTNGIFVFQSKYIANMLKKYGFSDCKSAKTPMSSSTSIGASPNGADVNATMFLGMIGSLLYFTASHTDIMFVTILCARYQANHKESHLHVISFVF